MGTIEIAQLKAISVTNVKGVGPARQEALAKLGVTSLYDLLFFYPRTYEDASAVALIADLVLQEKYQVVGKVSQLRENYARGRRGLIITKAVLTDDTGELGLIWFQQRVPTPSPILRKLKGEREVRVFGKVEKDRGYLVMKNPDIETALAVDSLHVGRIIPIYPLTEGITQKTLRQIIWAALDEYRPKLVDPLPESVRQKVGLLKISQALEELHYPTSSKQAEKARQRLAFDRLFALGLELEDQQRQRASGGIEHSPPGQLMQIFLAELPFEPTQAQLRAAQQIWSQMQKPYQMQHLLMGDVGSGKTLVAALAVLKTIEDQHQAAVMAPTSILTHQHYTSLTQYLAKLPVRIRLLVGETPAKEREEIWQELAEHRCDLVVGTHALIQEAVSFADLGLAVTDEQHRFGVRQREQLSTKGRSPDILIISATPIPRTLALAAYGELGYSVLDQLPPGRQPVITKWINSPRLERVWAFAQREVAAGYGGYVVCPLVEENPDLPEVRGVVDYARELQMGPLSSVAVGVLHGGMSAEEKAAVLNRFKEGQLGILVATTVVEIGVDVSRASFMVIMNAERFGLAQLHQLRGRVGRGQRQSYCILCSDTTVETARQRLQIMEKVAAGDAVAELDLKLRGPGEVFGLKQHGTEDLIFQTMLYQPALYEKAFACAQEWTQQELGDKGEVFDAYNRWFGQGGSAESTERH